MDTDASVRFLSERDRVLFEQRAQRSAISAPPRQGYFRLFNKNAGETVFVRPIEQCANRYGWLVEVEAVPRYFRLVLANP